MSKTSFCASVKEVLLNNDPKRKCCKRTFDDAQKAFGGSQKHTFSASDVLDRAKCDNCLREFLRSSFINRGNITDPEKQNHLDFTFVDESECEAVFSALSKAGFTPKKSKRLERCVLYFKDNDTVGDLLAYIGATKAAFDVMNSKIVKEIRNNANRLVNCDTANIEKAISASQKYVEAIEYITIHGSLEVLPGELKEAAELRLTYPQASLGELAQKCHPPITKSGMKHRLEKLLSASMDLRERIQSVSIDQK